MGVAAEYFHPPPGGKPMAAWPHARHSRAGGNPPGQPSLHQFDPSRRPTFIYREATHLRFRL